ncbi:MAG: DUF4190 domain-containing protein [Nocardioides sp.]
MSEQFSPPPPPHEPYPYGAPSYGGYQPVRDHPQAALVLVLGIVSVFVGVVGPVAWYLGAKAKREIEASGGRIGGLQQVTVGWILGIIMSILLLIGLAFFLVVALGALGVLAFAS